MDDIDEKQPKNTQVLEYFNNLKDTNKIIEVAVRFRSSRDIDILVAVEDDKVEISKILIESDLYTKPALQADIVNRQRGKILLLTKDKTTYEIEIISKSEFNSHYKIE